MSNFTSIVNAGVPIMQGNVGQSAAITGIKSRFAFSCLKCQTKYETTNEYALSDNMAKTMAKSQATSWISRILYMILGRIPFVGRMLSGLASSAVYQVTSAATSNPMEKAKDQAFTEVKSSFILCTKCNQIACNSCVQDGICSTCKNASAQEEVM